MLLMLLKGRTEGKDKCSAIVARSLGILPAIVVRNYAIIVNRMDTLSSNVLHAQKIDKAKIFHVVVSDPTTISSTATIAGTNQSFATPEMVQHMIITAFSTLGLHGQGKIVSSP